MAFAANTNALPSTRQLLRSLITSLGQPADDQVQRPADPVSTQNKPALLTLHTLFPNELLPALDLLDRGLVTRLHISADGTGDEAPPSPIREDSTEIPEVAPNRKPLALYTVRSAQPPPRSKHAVDAVPTTYVVHLTAWSCSCPAFAFAAFPAESSGDQTQEDEMYDFQASHFGGLTKGDGVAVCKHLLACVLAEWGGGFGQMVEERGADMDEIAGWAAGWGD